VRVLRGVEHAETAHRLVKETFDRSKLPFMDAGAFMRMVSGLGRFVEVLLAEYEGALQGCAVIPFSNHTAYYVYGGTIAEPLTGATNFLQWEAIRHFRGLGVKYYDFCGVRVDPEKGSKQAGLMMFKERFGPRLVRGYMWKRPLKPFKASAYTAAVRLLRGGDIVDAEHHKLE
jgi:lipid II:glycine glycyltransferase (peptidoglycan interpeptide bridge formation enzyme)